MGLPRFAVVDVETSGLRPKRDRVLQIGVVVVEADGTIVDTWSTLVRLRWPLGRVGPRHIHGITRRALRRSGVKPAEAFNELASRIDGAVFTAHNAGFDAAFLRRCATKAGVPLALEPPLCTLDLSRRLDPDRLLTHGLADVAARYQVSLVNHHDALADATATAAILPHLLAAHHVADPTDLEPLYLKRRPQRLRGTS